MNMTKEIKDALGVLGLSGQEKYLPILGKYALNAVPEIRDSAFDAAREIGYRLTNDSSDQIRAEQQNTRNR